jgi:protein-tyrosine phosphatase
MLCFKRRFCVQLFSLTTQPGVTSLYVPTEDGVPLPENLLQRGVEFVLSEKRRGQVVLIACGAGISRSVAYAVAVLKEEEDLSLLEALRVIKSHHPDSMPHPALWESLCHYYREEFSLHSMLDVVILAG